MYFLRTNQRPLAKCLQDIATVGFVDTKSIGCVASQVVLYVSLVFIVGVDVRALRGPGWSGSRVIPIRVTRVEGGTRNLAALRPVLCELRT